MNFSLYTAQITKSIAESEARKVARDLRRSKVKCFQITFERCDWGSGEDRQLPTLLGAYGCEWNPFLNCVNTIFNSACQTGKRRRRSHSLLGGLGQSPSRKCLGENLCVNGYHFSIALTTFSTLSLSWRPLRSCSLSK